MRDDMVAHALDELPNEACGLLAGRDRRAEQLYAMRNADESPSSYRLEPKQQLAVFDEIERNGMELIGIYHSHIRTEAYPSETDCRQAFYPEAHYVVVSLADPRAPVVRAFIIADGQVEEQELQVT